LDCLKVALHKVWESSRYTIPVNQGQLVQARLTDRAFTLQDTPAKSSPAPPASGGASRIGLVPAAPVEDLVGEEAGSTRLKEGRHASGRAAETHAIASKEPPNDSVAHTPRDRRSSATETQGTVTKQIASSDGDEGGTRCARDSHVGGGQERSSDSVEGEDVDGQPSTSQRVEESEGGSRDSASTPATTGCNAEADDVAVRGNGLFVDADDTPSRTVSGGIDAVAKGARGASSVRARAGRAPCPTLAYDMQSILGGCRKASRLKRKRDARNASADSFSAKLSGCGTKDQDSMAAARAFSRVLHKVGKFSGCDAMIGCTASQGDGLFQHASRISSLKPFVKFSSSNQCCSHERPTFRSRVTPLLTCVGQAPDPSLVHPRPSIAQPVLSSTAGALYSDACRRPIQPGLHDMPPGLGSLHLGPARL